MSDRAFTNRKTWGQPPVAADPALALPRGEKFLVSYDPDALDLQRPPTR